MTKYRATIHVSGISGETATAARAEIEALLRQSGIENCRVISVDPEGLAGRPAAPRPPAARVPDPAWRRQANAGGLLLVAAAAWAIWFFWWMLSNGHE